MYPIDYQQVLKWALIVLLAGFIGQFGKSFATYLIERARRKKKALADSDRTAAPVQQSREEPAPLPPVHETSEAQARYDKKAMKALIKLKKKGKEQ